MEDGNYIKYQNDVNIKQMKPQNIILPAVGEAG
jgi:hypothetical protein